MNETGMDPNSDEMTPQLSFTAQLDGSILRCTVDSPEEGRVYACYLYCRRNGTKETIYKDTAYSAETTREYDMAALLPGDTPSVPVSVKLFSLNRDGDGKRAVLGKPLYYPPLTGPRISVVVTVRGAASPEDTLDSLCAQEYRNAEFIFAVLDAGEAWEPRLREFAAAEPRAKVYRKKDMPDWEAFNFGLDKAEGDYLLFLDAGDRIAPTFFGDAMMSAQARQADLVFVSPERADPAAGEQNSAEEKPENALILWNKLFRRTLITENRLRFPACFGADAVFAFTAHALARRTAALQGAYLTRGADGEEPIPARRAEDPIAFITLLFELKKSLTDVGAYGKAEAPFLRFALTYIIGSLESICDYDGFLTAYRAVKGFGIARLGLLAKAADYYPKENEPLYREAAACLHLSAPEFIEAYGLNGLYSHRREIAPAFSTGEKRGIAVSVVVPVYNTERYLRECLDSILDSTMDSFEVLCVNDGSTDGSLSILREYQRKDSRVVLLDSRKNRGLAATRNAAFDIARGEYICCVDSDDWIEPDHLEKTYAYAKHFDLDMLFFDAAAHFESPELKERFDKASRQYTSAADLGAPRSGTQLLLDMIDSRTYRANMCLQLLKREHLDRHHIRLYPGILYEDVLFTFTSLLKSELCARISRPYYHRRYRDGSIIMQRKQFPHIRSYAVVIMEMMSELRRAGLGREREAKAFTRILHVANAMNAAYDALTEKEKTTFLERYLTPVEASWFQMIRQGRL